MAHTTEGTRRRFLKGAGVAAVAGIAGCSGGQGDGQDASSGATGTTTGSPSTTEIQFMHAQGGPFGELLDTIITRFNDQSSTAQVNPSFKGFYFETFNAIKSAIKAGNPPAIAQLVDVTQRQMIDSQAFVPVEDLLEVNWDDFYDPPKNYWSVDGTTWGLPFPTDYGINYYNKSKFEEAGLDPEDPPTTFQEMIDTSETLMSEGVVDHGITWPTSSFYVEQWHAETGNVLFDRRNGQAGNPTEAYLTDDAMMSIADWWMEMANNEYYLHTGKGSEGGWTAAIEAFNSQDAAMIYGSTAAAMSRQKAAENNGFEVGNAFTPAPSDSRAGVIPGGGSLWVADGVSDAKKEAAVEFLEFLQEPEQQLLWTKNTGYLPTTQSTTDRLEDENWFDNNPMDRTALEQMKAIKDVPATNGWLAGPGQKIRDTITAAYANMTTTGVTAEEAMSDAESTIESALRSYAEST